MHVIVFSLEIDHFLRWDMVNPWIKLTGIIERFRKLIVTPLITSACRRYKQCLQCVRMSNGDECIGEMVTYNQDETDGSCSDAGGSCERGLCECDAAFAEGKFIIIFAYVNVPHGKLNLTEKCSFFKNIPDYQINIIWIGIISMAILLKRTNVYDTVVVDTEIQNVVETRKEHLISSCTMLIQKFAAMMEQPNQMATTVMSIPHRHQLVPAQHQAQFHQLMGQLQAATNPIFLGL